MNTLANITVKRLILPLMLLVLAWAFYAYPMINEIAAGIAILLFGIIMLENGFKAFAQGPMEKMLKTITRSKSRSFGIGLLSTMILQSSALINIIAISFLSAGLISLKSGIAVAFGTNLGTTSTAWLVSVLGFKTDVALLAHPMLAFGLLLVLQKKSAIKGVGLVLAGLGFFFLGIEFMQSGFEAYKSGFDLTRIAQQDYKNVFLFTLIGIVLTIIFQSGSAVIVLVLTMLGTDQLDYFSALALVIGANIGNVTTMIIGAVSASENGKRLAGAQVIFKLTTGLVCLVLIFQLADFIDLIAHLFGVKADNYVVKLSMFHTMFNLIGCILMFPLMKRIIKFLKRIFPIKSYNNLELEQPKYLNKSVLNSPQSAARALLDESLHLYEKTTFSIVAKGLDLDPKTIRSHIHIQESIKNQVVSYDIDVEEMYYTKVKIIYGKIIKYATLSASEFILTPKLLSIVTRVKDASRNQVIIIKNIRGLHKNVKKYLHAENEYIREEYEKLRSFVAKTLKETYNLKKDPKSRATLDSLEDLKKIATTQDLLLSGRFEYLIREQKISSNMASSLANDSTNVNGIVLKMIETAELLYLEDD